MHPRDAALAATRFGLGAHPNEIERIGRDPRGWLEAQIDPSAPAPEELAGLSTTDELVRKFQKLRGGGEAGRDQVRRESREVLQAETAARCLAQARSLAPFRERWVAFWSNWFTVSVTRRQVVGIVGAYEREAIRPRVFGTFADLLLGVVRHPAMLVYLDNVQSVGPDSMAGQRGRGLNENLAREVLELHTLGVHGGYTQADVEAFAGILTGWGVIRETWRSGSVFRYEPRKHQPGPKTLLGKTYSGGEREGTDALRALAAHPATATHVATRVAAHFVSDDPPKSLVERLRASFASSGGDLGHLARTLVAAPEAWKPELGKIKTPWDLVVSTSRALGHRGDGSDMVRALRLLGQASWAAPSPAGWSDAAADWLGPDALLSRIDYAERIARLAAPLVERPLDRADSVLGPLLSDRTRTAIRTAPTRRDAVALLVASPEFQRR